MPRSALARGTGAVTSAAVHVLAGFAALVTLAGAATSASAQTVDPQCADPATVGSGLEGGDACQKALDLVRYLNPQLGMLLAGGNATLGQAGALGGLGRFSLTLRANASRQLGVPELSENDVAMGPAQRTAYQVTEEIGGFPVADVAVGLFEGFVLGPTRVGGVDAVVNVFYVPARALEEASDEEFAVSLPDGGLKLGYGVRLGVLGETRTIPGVSLTYIQRGLPTVSLTASTFDETGSGGDTLSLQGFSVRTSSWRLVAGKKLWIFAIAAGLGQDRYHMDGDLAYAVSDDVSGAQARGALRIDEEVTRTNMFADLSINLFLFRLVGEIGRVSGGDVATYNEFSLPAGRPLMYGAVGMRFGR